MTLTDSTPILKERIFSYEDVKIDGHAHAISTHIRHNLVAGSRVGLKRPAPDDADDTKTLESMEPFAYIHIRDEKVHIMFSPNGLSPTCRTQCRIVMNVYGWPVKYFKDLPEFARTIRDAIIGTSAA